MRSSHPATAASPTVFLLTILCPHCNTALACVPHGDDGDIAACLACGRFGQPEGADLPGGLAAGVLSAQEIEDFCAELGGLREQAARAEAMDRGD
jgi:hypothetical protein